LGIEVGRILGAVISISNLKLDSAMRGEVDGLVKEGWKLAETVGKGASNEVIEYQTRCNAIIERLESSSPTRYTIGTSSQDTKEAQA
jgi:hypothetical protein